ncbi:unnamed protein product, partial [Ilex paraguariensis]
TSWDYWLGSIGSKVAQKTQGLRRLYIIQLEDEGNPFSYTFYPKSLNLHLTVITLIICCSLIEDTYHMINNYVMKALGRMELSLILGAGDYRREGIGEMFGGRKNFVELAWMCLRMNLMFPKELFALDNVVMLPHRAAFTEESFYDA